MNKKIGIILSLVMALIFTSLVVIKSNQKYNQIAEKVEVTQAAHYIPAGTKITSQDVVKAEVIKTAANGLAAYNDVVGKTTKVSLLKDQYVYMDGLSTADALMQGYVEVYVPVELSSSAFALPGEKVDVYLIDKNTKQSRLALSAVPVLNCMDNQGREVEVGKMDLVKAAGQQNIPASIGVMIPRDQVVAIVSAASEKSVYLVKCAPSEGAN
jgi:Flp pilus assembly protein CpaB